MVKGRWVLAVFGVTAGLLGALYLSPSEEKKIKNQFSLLAEYVSKEEGEKILAMAGKMRNLESLFADPLAVKAPPYALSGNFTRSEIAGLAARARLHFSHLVLDFHDLSISFPEKDTAQVVLTGRVRGKTSSGETVYEVREMECIFKKSQEQWLIHRWEVVEVLKR